MKTTLIGKIASEISCALPASCGKDVVVFVKTNAPSGSTGFTLHPFKRAEEGTEKLWTSSGREGAMSSEASGRGLQFVLMVQFHCEGCLDEI